MTQQDKNAYINLSKEAKRFLEQHLPQIGGEGWWQTHVFSQLTYGQQGQVRSRGIQTLGGLDLAALLRVFERNWAELSHTADLPAVLRTYLHEIKELRNLLSHQSVDGEDFAPADRFRYLDTILRVMKALGADNAVCQETEKARDSVFVNTPSALPSEPKIVEVIREVQVEVPVEVIREVKVEVPVEVIREVEVVREIHVEVPAATNASPTSPDLAGGIQVGPFTLLGPSDPLPGKLTAFNKELIDASLIGWKVHHPSGLEFDLQVAMIDEGSAKEVAQVQCTNRHQSPQIWDDIVNRLRIGIQPIADGEWMMELKCAVRPNGGRATRNVWTLADYQQKTGLRLESILTSLGATAVGTRAEITDDTGRNRNYPAATFLPGDSVIPVVAWVLTTLVPLAKN